MMLQKIAILLVAVVAVLASGVQSDKDRILNFLRSIEGKKMLSGSFGGYINCGFSLEEANNVFRATSKYPAVYGIDCATGWDTTQPGRETDIIQCFSDQAINYTVQGGLLSVSHHLPNPILPGNVNPDGDLRGNQKKISNEEYGRLLREATPEKNRWYQFLNKVAEGLAEYQTRGITVLYRPLHEMNGEWFWWGNTGYNADDQERQELYKALWRDMHNYFTNHKGLKNLVWVYSPAEDRVFKTGFYPGPQFVDVVGLDAYVNDFNDVRGYDELLTLGKPFAIAEMGPRESNAGNLDYTAAINAISNHFPKTIYYLAWNDKWSPATNKNPVGALNNPKVLNRGEFRI